MKVINGNNIDILKQYPDNYFDAIVTDPPYGLGKEPNAEALMKDWIEKGYHEISGTGFMGKEWDAFIPQPLFWKEAFRVLKHGGHVLSFFGTRTYDWGVMSMRFAGFEVRDCIQWLYGSGFPKSHNVGKSVDKMYGAEREFVGKNINHRERNNPMSEMLKLSDGNITAPTTDQAKQWDGWGSALKPANEPIVLARKPLEKGLTIAENVLKWGTGAINIDGCRIGFKNESDKASAIPQGRITTKSSQSGVGAVVGGVNDYEIDRNEWKDKMQGRFPANLILTHNEDCECVGTKKVGNGERKNHEDGEVSSANEGYVRPNKSSFTHKDSSVIANYGEETIEDWNCVDDCPIKILDEQSGESKSQRSERGNILDNNVFGKYNPQENTTRGHSDKGGASRFFYVAKASKSERNKGLDGFEEKRPDERSSVAMGSFEEKGVAKQSNFHPTVKPIKLMQYLVRLITPPNGIVLDPFCGSGTTGVACKLEGFQFVGLEQDADYAKIAQARIDNYEEEKPTVKKSIKIEEIKTNQIDIFNSEL